VMLIGLGVVVTFAVMLVLFHPRIIVVVLLGMVGLRVRVAVGCVDDWQKIRFVLILERFPHFLMECVG